MLKSKKEDIKVDDKKVNKISMEVVYIRKRNAKMYLLWERGEKEYCIFLCHPKRYYNQTGHYRQISI